MNQAHADQPQIAHSTPIYSGAKRYFQWLKATNRLDELFTRSISV